MQQDKQSVRCGRCNLVQFLTKDELCRRCHEPLTLVKYLDINFPVWRLEQRQEKVIRSLSASADRPCRGHFSRQLGLRLKQLRLEKGLRRDQMKKVMHSSSLSRIETGQHYPSLAVLEKFSDVLGIPIREIVGSQTKSYHTDFALDDPLVSELGLYLRILSWPKWLEVVVLLKKLNMNLGPESLRLRAQLEREYCQGV